MSNGWFGSNINTKSPGSKFRAVWFHFRRRWRLGRYSFLFQILDMIDCKNNQRHFGDTASADSYRAKIVNTHQGKG